MTKVMAALSGLVAASLVTAIIGVWLTPVVTGNFVTAITFVGIFFLFSLVVTLVFGAPLFFLCFYLKIIRWWSSLIAGGLVGMLVAFGLSAPHVYLQDLLRLGSVGALAAYCFWVFWRLGK